MVIEVGRVVLVGWWVFIASRGWFCLTVRWWRRGRRKRRFGVSGDSGGSAPVFISSGGSCALDVTSPSLASGV